MCVGVRDLEIQVEAVDTGYSEWSGSPLSAHRWRSEGCPYSIRGVHCLIVSREGPGVICNRTPEREEQDLVVLALTFDDLFSAQC